MKKIYDEIFQQIALEEGISVEEVKAEMQKAIDSAYNNDDRQCQDNFMNYFGKKKPSIEEFIEKVSEEIRKRHFH